jgi:hypothetical protein
MTSLEYIRNKISKKIKTINEKRNFMANCKIMNIPFNSNLTYEDEKELEYLRQVESELEAWEVVKDKIIVKEVPNYFYQQYRIFLTYMNGKINSEQYERLKKLLEVEECEK